MYSYYIFNSEEDLILPDKSKYYAEIKYVNCDYLKFFQDRPKTWGLADKKSKEFFFSNYEARSYIKTFSTDLVRKISNKIKLSEMLAKNFYYPETVIFQTKNNILPKSFEWNPEQGSLWFLKKASDLTYGGFDVFPLRYVNKKKSLKEIQRLIFEANKVKKYQSDYFVLQRGIERPLLIDHDGSMYKFDIRAFGLFVKISPDHPMDFYFFKKFLIRRSIDPYNPKKLTKETMLTNTTQASQKDIDYGSTITLGTMESHEEIFEKMFEVYVHLIDDHLTSLDQELPTSSPCITIIGLDFIFDESKDLPYILEINKYPTIICDKEKRAKGHFDMEDSMFADDFYDVSFDAILRNVPKQYSTENWLHVSEK